MKYTENLSLSNEIFLPSSKTGRDDAGNIVLGDRARIRGDRTLDYYDSNQDIFKEAGAFILISGGFSGLASGEAEPEDASVREATLLADYLVRHGVPSGLIEKETKSQSGLSNVAESIRGGFIDPAAYYSERKLGIVAPKLYQRRLQQALGKVGLPKDAIQPIYTNETESLVTEVLGLAGTWALTLNAHTPDDLLRAEATMLNSPLAGRSRNEG